MATNIVRSHDVATSDIAFSKQVRTLDSGYKMVWVTYKGAPMVVQLPKMKAPFGLSKWADDKGTGDKYSIDLSFAGMDSNEKLGATYETLKTLDDMVVEAALANSQEWFKKKITSKEVTEALNCPTIKTPKDEKYAPTIKLPLKESSPGGPFTALVFDNDRNKIDLKHVECKGSEVQAIVQCSHIWIAGGKFGISWKVSQLKVQPRAALTEYAFQPDEDEDVYTGVQGNLSDSDLEV